MSDFTKEELESMLEGVNWFLDGDSSLYSEALINKIQSMIENYCEHESLFSEGEMKHCCKCGEWFK